MTKTNKSLTQIDPNNPDLLNAIFNHHFQLTGLLDTDGRLLMVNETALEMIGVSEEEVLGKFFWDTPWWNHSTTIQEQIIKAIEKANTGVFVRFETEHTDTHGKRRSFDFSLNPLLNENQKVQFLVPEARDITEIKETQHALQTALGELNELKEKLEKENHYLKEEIRVEQGNSGMVGTSRPFKYMLQQIEQVANTDTTVLILGETGTGKELVARAIHSHSQRSDKPLVKVNCAALPSNLIESELFGHEKGAFTGAMARKTGRFELAHQGTLFLDEIGDLPLDLQAKLLRVLQEGELERVGSSETLKVNVRVLAATNHDLKELIREGKFREDLYYRLNVFPIYSPALRDRREDIPLLVQHFVDKLGARLGKRVATIPQKSFDALVSYHWPGNVRELENIIERALIISSNDKLELGEWFIQQQSDEGNSGILTLADSESQHILKALEQTSWRVSGPKGAARLLGLKPTTLESRMKKLGISRHNHNP